MKREATIAVIAVILMMGIYAKMETSDMGLKSIVPMVIDTMETTVTKNIEIASELSTDFYELEVQNTDVEIESQGSYTIKTSDITLDSKTESLNLIDFNGKIKYDGQFKLTGTTNKIKKRDSELNLNKDLTINLDDAIISFDINNLNLNFPNIDGVALINNKFNLKLEDSLFELESFSGDIILDNNHFSLNGRVVNFQTIDDNIEVRNK
jgi:hypothetical protein